MVVLTIVLVWVFDGGVNGALLALVAGHSLTTVASLWYCRRRCGLTLRYVAPHVEQVELNSLGNKYPTILVRGEDRYGHFPEQPMPFALAAR